jgi:uncharacterized small protein (DUF1192 family)
MPAEDWQESDPGGGRMDIEDLEPRKAKPQPKDLEAMGIEELEAYLGELETEAERVRAKIASKKSYMEGAEAFFKR